MKKLLVNKKKYLPIIPAIILYSMVIYGILLSVVRSFGFYNAVGLNSFTLKYLFNIFNDKRILLSLSMTFIMSTVSTLLSVGIGIIISIYLIEKKIKNNKLLYIMVPVPHIVVAFMFIVVLSQNGLLSRLFYHMHLINSHSDFPLIINDRFNIGITLAYVFKSVSYVLTVIYILLNKTNDKYFEVAYSLGLSFKRYVFEVLLPINQSAIWSTCLILFVYSFGAFEIPYILGNTSYKLLSVIAYEKYISSDLSKKPEFYAINLVMLIVGIVVMLLYKKIMDKVSNEKYIF